jgi:hypothetical protein
MLYVLIWLAPKALATARVQPPPGTDPRIRPLLPARGWHRLTTMVLLFAFFVQCCIAIYFFSCVAMALPNSCCSCLDFRLPVRAYPCPIMSPLSQGNIEGSEWARRCRQVGHGYGKPRPPAFFRGESSSMSFGISSCMESLWQADFLGTWTTWSPAWPPFFRGVTCRPRFNLSLKAEISILQSHLSVSDCYAKRVVPCEPKVDSLHVPTDWVNPLRLLVLVPVTVSSIFCWVTILAFTLTDRECEPDLPLAYNVSSSRPQLVIVH